MARVDETFFGRFFGDGNDIRWAEVGPGADGAAAVALRPFLREADGNWEYLLLPRIHDGRLSWYAIASRPRIGRVLREELLAFVGPSYSTFRGQYAVLDPRDSIERAVYELGGRHVFRLDVIDRTQREPCRQRLLRMLDVRARRSRHIRITPRPTGRILRDFELATQAGQREDAEAYLVELRSRATLSARNLTFLQVHLHSSFGEWTALSMMLEDGALLLARRPLRVTQALIRAVYLHEFARFEELGDPAAAVEHFKTAIQPRFGRLYRSTAGLTGPMIIESLLIATLAQDPENLARRDELLSRLPAEFGKRDYVDDLAGLFLAPSRPAPTLEPDLLAEGKQQYLAGKLELALQSFLACDIHVEALSLVIRCAFELGTLDAGRAALEAFACASETTRDAVTANALIRRPLDELRAPFQSQLDAAPTWPEVAPPRTWIDWFDRLERDPSWPGATEVAAQAASEWSVSEIATTSALDAIAKRLESTLADQASERLSEALPHLLTFFVLRAGSDRRFIRVQIALLDHLAYSEAQSIETIRAMGLVLDTLVHSGIDRERADTAITLVSDAWAEQPALDLLDWALDVLEAIVTSQVASKPIQVAFVAAVHNNLTRWHDRLSAAQVRVFSQLCREAQVEVDLDNLMSASDDGSSTEDGLVQVLSGRKVALYSLREEALTRAQAILEQLVPNIDVRRYSDKVASTRLNHAARTADLFVIVTGAAKHAATLAIEALRPPEAATVRCHATGSAGLIRAIHDWAFRAQS